MSSKDSSGGWFRSSSSYQAHCNQVFTEIAVIKMRAGAPCIHRGATELKVHPVDMAAFDSGFHKHRLIGQQCYCRSELLPAVIDSITCEPSRSSGFKSKLVDPGMGSPLLQMTHCRS